MNGAPHPGPPPSTAPKPPHLQKPPGYRDPSAPKPPAPARPPQRKQPLPPSFRRPIDARKHQQRRRPRSCCCRRLCCCCLLSLLALLFLVALAGGLSYLYFQPKLPSFHLQSLRVPQFRVSVRPDGSYLDAAANATVQATNPNGKIRLWYEPGSVAVSAVDEDGSVWLGSGAFGGFRQGRMNSTVVRVQTGVKGAMVDDGVGSRLRSRFQSKDIRFVVEIRTRVRIGIGGGEGTGWLPVRVVCGEVSLKQMANGDLPKCSFRFLRWIKIS